MSCAPPFSAEQQAVDAARGVERAAALEKLAGSRQALLDLSQERDSAGDGKAEAAIARVRKVLGQEGGAVVMPIVTGLGGKLVVVTAARRRRRVRASSTCRT